MPTRRQGRAGVRAALLAAAAATLVGCGVGGVLAGAAGGGGGGGGSKAPPPPPSVEVAVAQAERASNYVTITFKLIDEQVRPNDDRPGGDADPRVRIRPQYRIATDQTWFDMTEAQVPASEGVRALPLTGKDQTHTFVWNTVVDRGENGGGFKVRVLAEYEAAEGIRRRFRSGEADLTLDGRLAATVFGQDVAPRPDVDTFPVDVRPDGDGFVVADLGANIVERVDVDGQPRRLAGFGVPGDTAGAGRDPGVARLPTLVGFDMDAFGNLYTNHRDKLLVTNRGAADLVFGLRDGPDADALSDTVVVAPKSIATVPIVGLQQSTGLRFHPTGALIVTNLLSDGFFEILAINPQDPDAVGSTSVVLGAVTVAPGAVERLVGGGADAVDGAAGLATRVTDAASVAVGPDGEIYYVERSLGRVRVLNATSATLSIGGRDVVSGAVDTVVGGNGLGHDGDGDPARLAQLNLPLSIDVSASRMLFIADTSSVRVRAANLSTVQQTFAETEVAAGEIETVVGGGIGGVGSKARAIKLDTPNAVSLDAGGRLLVADRNKVILVNGGTLSVAAYGKTASPARTATVYDASQRGGLPLLRPRAALLRDASSKEVFFTDRTTVRVLNLARTPEVFGGAEADAGGVAIVAGGAVPGYSGDGGPARSSAFDAPSALASDALFRLFVADTGNDRVRCINVGDPLINGPQTVFGRAIAPGNVDTVLGGAAGPLPADGDGLAPRDCSLAGPLGVALSRDGLLFVADTGHHRLRCVNPGPADATVAGVVVPAGTIATVVGGGVAGFTADGPGPWLIDTPTALAVDKDLLYFAEAGNARIRVLNFSAAQVHVAGVDVPSGRVGTICGSGVRGNGGDFGRAVDAQIDTPRAFFVATASGNRRALFFTDGAQHVIRMVNLTDADVDAAQDADGKVSMTAPGGGVVTLAGGPNTPGVPNIPAFGGDGLEAAQMRFSSPWGVVFTARDACPASVFVMDEGNDRVRRFGAPPVRSCFVGP